MAPAFDVRGGDERAKAAAVLPALQKWFRFGNSGMPPMVFS